MPSDFASLLAAHRKASGLSMLQLAKLSETQNATISLVESRRRTPPIASVERWAKALGLRGAERASFLATAKAEKARAQGDAVPYIEDLERRIASAGLALRDLVAACREQGLEVPDALVERIESLLRNDETSDLGR